MSQAALIDALKVVNTHCAAGLAPDDYATELGTAVYGNTDGPGAFQTYDVSSGDATYSGGSVLSITGTIATNRTITLPTTAARYTLIVNVTPSSGGPYTVTIKTAAAGKQTLIYPTIAYGDTRTSPIPTVDVIVDSSGNVYASDFSVAGSNSNGSYIKFGDGTLECYGQSALLTASTGSSPPIYYSGVLELSFPYRFLADSVPVVTTTTNGNTSYYEWSATGTVRSTHMSVVLMSIDSGASGYVMWKAMGRWRA